MVRIISVVTSSLAILLGVLFIVGAFSESTLSWLLIGGILVGIGILIMWLGTRQRAPEPGSAGQNVTLKIDLPGNVSLDSMKCKSCGGTLSSENVKMVAGAPIVSCPFCHTQYQLTEDPKW